MKTAMVVYRTAYSTAYMVNVCNRIYASVTQDMEVITVTRVSMPIDEKFSFTFL